MTLGAGERLEAYAEWRCLAVVGGMTLCGDGIISPLSSRCHFFMRECLFAL